MILKLHSYFNVIKSLLNALHFEYIEVFLINDLKLLHVFGRVSKVDIQL